MTEKSYRVFLNRYRFSVFISIFVLIIGACSIRENRNNDLTTFLSKVEKIGIGRKGYIIGKKLDAEQMEKAVHFDVESDNPATLKFKDGNLFVVVEKNSKRVLILYEQLKAATPEKIREMVGNLFFEFETPTIMAHDRIIYWCYNNKGKISEESFQELKSSGSPINILATVKFQSNSKITDLKAPAGGNVYYIISSEPALKLLK